MINPPACPTGIATIATETGNHSTSILSELQQTVPIMPKPLPSVHIAPVFNRLYSRIEKRPRHNFRNHTMLKYPAVKDNIDTANSSNKKRTYSVHHPTYGSSRTSCTTTTKNFHCNRNNSLKTSQTLPPYRRRSPTLERLPRWMFPPVRQFLSPSTQIPLPRKVAVCGKPFYDWDAWAVSLLHPIHWRSRGPWERLIRSCDALRSSSSQLTEIKASLIRIVVAEVVSMLVGRSGEELTAEDRNWITSVASRQKGNVRKPTLCSILDFAFPMFELSAYARMPYPQLPSFSSTLISSSRDVCHSDAIMTAYEQIVDRINAVDKACEKNGPDVFFLTPPLETDRVSDDADSMKETSMTTMEPVVAQVMGFIQDPSLSSHVDLQKTPSTGLSVAERIHPVSSALQLIADTLPSLETFNINTDLHISSKTKSCDEGWSGKQNYNKLIDRAAIAFVYALPPLPSSDSSSTTKLLDKHRLSAWLRDAMTCSKWVYWSLLAYDFSFIRLYVSDSEVLDLKTRLCEKIVTRLFDAATEVEAANQSCSSSDDTSGKIMTTMLTSKKKCHATGKNSAAADSVLEQTHLNQAEPTIRMVLDVAIEFDMFVTAFIKYSCTDVGRYSEDVRKNVCSAVANYHDDASNLCFPEIGLMVEAYDNLVQALSVWRAVLLGCGERREMAMIGWSERSLKMARFLKSVIVGYGLKTSDIERAIQNAFAEASWPTEMRSMRYMVPQCHYQLDQNRGVGQQQQQPLNRLWVLDLDMNDAMIRAIAIAPWDACHAIELIDECISLSEERKKKVCAGREGCLPLWDLRRIEVCRRLMAKESVTVMSLGMERLQSVFDLRELHEGGNFATDNAQWLTRAIMEGNLCAQTTLGLLLAGEGEYWDVARNWARCDKETEQGVKMLYDAARSGDREACTALSHIWAQQGVVCRHNVSCNRNSSSGNAMKRKRTCPTGAETEGSIEEDYRKGKILVGYEYEHLVELFKTAVDTQNADAVLNLGVLWKCGVDEVLQADRGVALDCFLMTLQGTCSPATREMAAVHLEACYSEGSKDRKMIIALSSVSRAQSRRCGTQFGC